MRLFPDENISLFINNPTIEHPTIDTAIFPVRKLSTTPEIIKILNETALFIVYALDPPGVKAVE